MVCAKNLEKCNRPIKLLQLYCFENDNGARQVRETLAILDLDVIIFPCPLYGMPRDDGYVEISRFRPVAKHLEEGKALVLPLLCDPNNASKCITGGGNISEYLIENYGKEALIPINYRILMNSFVDKISLSISGALRLVLGNNIRIPNISPTLPLELWNCEALPSCTLVRDQLCVLEQPYLLRNISYGSSVEKVNELNKLSSLASLWEKLLHVEYIFFIPPILYDPNTDSIIKGSLKIVDYLNQNYTKKKSIEPTLSSIKLNLPVYNRKGSDNILIKEQKITKEIDSKNITTPEMSEIDFIEFEAQTLVEDREELSTKKETTNVVEKQTLKKRK